jgi:hypothetical protein
MKRLRRGGYPVDDHVLESSGRALYAHAGIIGIDDAGSVFQGFDGTIETYDYRESYINEGPGSPPDPPPLTDAERRELAEEMVARWKKWGRL